MSKRLDKLQLLFNERCDYDEQIKELSEKIKYINNDIENIISAPKKIVSKRKPAKTKKEVYFNIPKGRTDNNSNSTRCGVGKPTKLLLY